MPFLRAARIEAGHLGCVMLLFVFDFLGFGSGSFLKVNLGTRPERVGVTRDV